MTERPIGHYSGSDSSFQTPGDFILLEQALKNPRWNIPDRMRDKVLNALEHALSSNNDRISVQAAKVVLAADKLNIDLIRIATPRKVEHHIDIKKVSDEELKVLVGEAVTYLQGEPKLLGYQERPL